MMRLLRHLALPALSAMLSAAAVAQPVDLPIPVANLDRLPATVHILRLPGGAVYADADGHVLYGMDMRTLIREGVDPAQHCIGDCAATWKPLLAPPGSEPTISFPRHYGKGIVELPRSASTTSALPLPADWGIIAGPQGPQWVYKNWHMVFVRRGDRPGSTAFDGAEEQTWNTLKFIPPIPKVIAPGNVQPIAVKGDYILADADGHALFTGSCAQSCAGWQPLGAGMASAAIGEWTVNTRGDAPQWLWRGKPVFVSQEDDPKQIPASTQPLKP